MTAWLLTWLWQGLALTAVVAAALRCVPRLNAATKHLIWAITLGALTWLGWASSPETALESCATGGTGLQPCLSAAGEPVLYVPTAPDLFITVVIGIWTAVALVNLLRLLPGLHAIYALRDRCRALPSQIEQKLPLWLEAKAHGRPADLMICDSVPGATVLGLQRPCIAIPSSLVDALTVDELDQVILHEHAHVQRRDDWSRLAQTLLLSVVWIHPAAFFIARALNREREMACDDWVVARTGLPKAYARCLAHAAEARARPHGYPPLVPAFLGRRHELVRRVDRVLTLKGHARRNASLFAAAAATMVMAVALLQLQELRFAEIADIMLPHVAGPVFAVDDEATNGVAKTPLPVRLKPDTTAVAAVAITARFAPSVPNALGAPNAPSAPSVPITPIASSVAFPGVYPVPDAPLVQSSVAPNRWSALGAPGVEVAQAAKKTSIGIANVFSRAGVSLARSF